MSIINEMNAAKNALHEIANQAYNLAMGLQNAAPAQVQTSGPPKSVQYLLETSLYINKASQVIEENETQDYEKLIQLIREMIQHDVDLRAKYGVAEKFRFVRDRMQAWLMHFEDQVKILKVEEQAIQQEDAVDKTLAYVYLYNAQGAILRTWLTLLTPKVFYEYSINRPIYHEKSHIESLIRLKPNKQQHAYLTVKINQSDIISVADSAPKDVLGQSLIKIREGSLRFENLVTFTHNEQNYSLSVQGEFIKK